MELSPLFSQLRRAIEARVGNQAEEVDINGWMARTTLEMLGQAGLGYSFDNFVDDSTDSYGESIKLFLYVASTLFLSSQSAEESFSQPSLEPSPTARIHRSMDFSLSPGIGHSHDPSTLSIFQRPSNDGHFKHNGTALNGDH